MLMYYYKIISDIEKYIYEETAASKCYKELSITAPSRLSKEMLMGFSEDEQIHAENFKKAYYYLTGRIISSKNTFLLIDSEAIDINNYGDSLKSRLLSETKDYKKYGEQYLNAPNKFLKDLFFVIKSAEAQHAMRIPVLFDEIKD